VAVNARSAHFERVMWMLLSDLVLDCSQTKPDHSFMQLISNGGEGENNKTSDASFFKSKEEV
jgi:hypothetical protein